MALREKCTSLLHQWQALSHNFTFSSLFALQEHIEDNVLPLILLLPPPLLWIKQVSHMLLHLTCSYWQGTRARINLCCSNPLKHDGYLLFAAQLINMLPLPKRNRVEMNFRSCKYTMSSFKAFTRVVSMHLNKPRGFSFLSSGKYHYSHLIKEKTVFILSDLADITELYWETIPTLFGLWHQGTGLLMIV